MTTATLTRHTAPGSNIGSVMNEAMVWIGEKFNLYDKLAETGPATAGELARASGVPGALISHWLSTQAAADYLYVDSEGRYSVYCPLPGRSN